MPRQPDHWMWADACRMLEQAERLHRQFFQLGGSSTLQPAWEPPIDVYETSDRIWIFAALPGVPADQVTVMLDHNRVVIVGLRPVPTACRNAEVVRMEIPHGRLERVIDLPARRLEILRRDLVDGCLHLCLRKL
ncbi:MAG: Hsp20/alpha crystallin family protein [Rhodospirillales bacterium]|nr:Hsp20/alpha crystallin family protein [Rhodospirillales bacterium]